MTKTKRTLPVLLSTAVLLGGAAAVYLGARAPVQVDSPSSLSTERATPTPGGKVPLEQTRSAPQNEGATPPSRARIPRFEALEKAIAEQGLPIRPEFAPVEPRPGETDLSVRRRADFVQSFHAFAETAQLSEEQQAQLRTLFRDSQINYAVLEASLSKSDAVKMLSGEIEGPSRPAMARALEEVEPLLREGFHRILKPEQEELLEKPPHERLLLTGVFLARPFDVDELALAGVAKKLTDEESVAVYNERNRDRPDR